MLDDGGDAEGKKEADRLPDRAAGKHAKLKELLVGSQGACPFHRASVHDVVDAVVREKGVFGSGDGHHRGGRGVFGGDRAEIISPE